MSTLESTVSMLEMLSEKDLMVIQSVAAAFLEKYEMYQPQTEDQLLARIDAAIEHAQQGKLRDGREISSELRARYGI